MIFIKAKGIMYHRIYSVLFLNILFTIFSCERPGIELIIYNSIWPEGTIISLIHGNQTLSRSSLYGGHVRLNVPKTATYRIRAASRTSLSGAPPAKTLPRTSSSIALTPASS